MADLGAGRKAWRQLRAELRLEDDTLGSLVARWRVDEARVAGALRRVLAAQAAAAVTERLALAAGERAAAEAKRHPNEWESIARTGARSSAPSSCSTCPSSPDPGSPLAGAVEKVPTLDDVAAALPLLPPGTTSLGEGQEERSRALRRRLPLMLPQGTVDLVKEAGTELYNRGPAFATAYLEKVWQSLRPHAGAAELLADLISTQSDVALQRALRAALRQLLCGRQVAPRLAPVRGASAAPQVALGNWLGLLPEAQLLQALSFCAEPASLCAAGAAGAPLRAAAGSDQLWATIWRRARWAVPTPAHGLRTRYLARLASQCAECAEPTQFEHAIVGCRLCELCERSYARYALVRSSAAMQEYQLPEMALRSLPHMDGATGRVYLRCAVEALAERYHSRASLQQLRAKYDIGVTAVGRQRRPQQSKASGPKGRGAAGPPARLRRAARDDDPCCFEATALIRANEAPQVW